jgi:crossover junction endodeoxyribonuclease RusA
MSEGDSLWPLRIVIPGKPVGKERPRLGRGGNVYTPAKTREYERTVAWTAKAAMGRRAILVGPVSLTINCIFSSKSRGWHVDKPDMDNLIKALADGMNGVVYEDDRQISHLVVSKINGLSDEVTVVCKPL